MTVMAAVELRTSGCLANEGVFYSKTCFLLIFYLDAIRGQVCRWARNVSVRVAKGAFDSRRRFRAMTSNDGVCVDFAVEAERCRSSSLAR